MKVKVDGTLCTGHGRCYALAPDVYAPDEEGYNNGRDSLVDVPEGHEQSAQLGVATCPEGAMTVVED
jgi:ferredoxin